MKNITILGAGHFGMVLYDLLSEKNHFPHHITLIKRGDKINLATQDFLLVALPVKSYNEVFKQISSHQPTLPPTILFSKGMNQMGLLPMAIIQKYFPSAVIGVLAGPNFAFELKKKLPTASVLSSTHPTLIKSGQTLLQQPFWRIYPHPDPIAVQLNGAMKNVLAIAVGIAHGKNLGLNATASLISRGLTEMKKLLLAEKLAGADNIDENACYGLSGVGDLILTTGSNRSRNTALGIKLGQGIDITSALQSSDGVAEGYDTSQQIARRAQQLNIDLPIINTITAVLHNGLAVDKAIEQLLTRPLPERE
ncbi:MAG: NAD(P)H-dependent glycerol-3-phosphate dehydrogenase [Alphaproteobacteria bacterium]